MSMAKVSKLVFQAVICSLVVLAAAQDYRVLEILVLWICFLLIFCVVATTVLFSLILYAAAAPWSMKLLVPRMADVRAHAHGLYVRAQGSSTGGSR